MQYGDDLFWFLIGALATWRISSILVDEEIFAPFRRKLGIVEEDVLGRTIPNTFFGKLFSCLLCMSIWIGIIVLILVLLPWARLGLVPFAFSAVAVILERKVFN